MRTYQRRPNMEYVPYGGRAKHPEHAAEYQLDPAARALAHIKKANEELAAVQERLHRVMQGTGLRGAQRQALQAAYQKIGLARGDLDDARAAAR